MTTTDLLRFAMAWARTRVAQAKADERGVVTETVILIAVFAALALAVGAIIVFKVTEKAKNIPTS